MRRSEGAGKPRRAKGCVRRENSHTTHAHADWETWKVVVREHPEVHSMLIVELILNCELCILYRLTVLLVDFHLCLRVVLYHC